MILSICFIAFAPLTAAQEKQQAAFTYKPPIVGAGVFSEDLGMLDKEREEYAQNLANYIGLHIKEQKASKESLEQARRFLALSLHLAPRNRKTIVMNFQLQRGILPATEESDYSPSVFAKLLLTRAQALEKSKNTEDLLLASCFAEIAAEMDPTNEDAVYASELLRIDKRQVKWSLLTDVKPTP
jgi:hypothetical protein